MSYYLLKNGSNCHLWPKCMNPYGFGDKSLRSDVEKKLSAQVLYSQTFF